MASLRLDHVVVAVHDLARAVHDYEALGFVVRLGGVHANRATRNALIAFRDGAYLELLAPTGEPPVPARVDFSGLVAGGEGLAGFALRADDLEAEVARLRAAGVAAGDVIPGARLRDDGQAVRWKLALIDGGFAPFLIEDVTPRTLRVPDEPDLTAHSNGALGVRAVQVAVADVEAARPRFAALLGVPPESISLSSASGAVALREDETAPDGWGRLCAVALAVGAGAVRPLPPDRTHRVQFELVPSP